MRRKGEFIGNSGSDFLPRLPARKVGTPASPEQPFVVYRWGVDSLLYSSYIHPGLEIGAVVAGHGKLYLEGAYFPLRPGDLYFLDPLLPHGHESPDRNPLEMVVAHVQRDAVMSALPLEGDIRLYQPFAALKKGLPPVLHDAEGEGRGLQEALLLCRQRPPHWDILAWSKIHVILTTIFARAFPLLDKEDLALSGSHETAAKASQYIHAHFREPLAVEDVARQCGLSASRLQHVFSAVLGISIIDYRNRLRIGYAAMRLGTGRHKLAHIASEAGFQSLAQFHELFKKLMGRTPEAFRMSLGTAKRNETETKAPA